MSTSRGRPLLLDSANHRYRQLKNNPDGTIVYWACLKEKTNKCKVRLHTTTNFAIIKVRGLHTHAPDAANSKSEKVEYVNLLSKDPLGSAAKENKKTKAQTEKEIEVISFLGQKEASKEKSKTDIAAKEKRKPDGADVLQKAIEGIDDL